MYEKLFVNAKVVGNDGADAVLVRGERIAAVGSGAECTAKAGSEAGRIECHGASLVPGFIDSHTHLVEAGDALLTPDVAGEPVSVILDNIGRACRENSDGTPYVAMGLDDRQFNELRVGGGVAGVSDHGVLVLHSSGHVAIADPSATALLGRSVGTGNLAVIDEPYEDPVILALLQRNKRQEHHLKAAVGAAVQRLSAYGITGIHDNTWDPQILRFLAGSVRGMDVLAWGKGTEGPSALHLADGIRLPENIAAGPIKFFLDGAFFNRTAWLHEPYLEAGGWCGAGMSADAIATMIEPFVAKDRQCVFHAAGDRAISELLDAVEILQPLYPRITDLRLRIEHSQLVAEEDYERIRKLGMVASVQASASMNPARDVRMLGEERAARAYPHKRLVEEGIPLAMGTDFPYEETMDPFEGLKWACARPLGESLTHEEALQAYTQGSAYAGFSEKHLGKIAPGYRADFFLTEEDPLEGINRGAEAIQATYSRGFCVYDRDAI